MAGEGAEIGGLERLRTAITHTKCGLRKARRGRRGKRATCVLPPAAYRERLALTVGVPPRLPALRAACPALRPSRHHPHNAAFVMRPSVTLPASKPGRCGLHLLRPKRSRPCSPLALPSQRSRRTPRQDYLVYAYLLYRFIHLRVPIRQHCAWHTVSPNKSI